MKNVIVVVSIFLVSCAALGSKTRISNDVKVREIRTVGLITKRSDQPRNRYHQIIKESFTRTLIAELEKKNLFKVVVLDTMENEKLNVESYVTEAPVDALLLAEWKLTNPNNMVTDSKVQLTLLDKETKEILLTSSHGTKFGNSYWSTPTLPKTLLDATEGALNTMEKHIRSRQ
jgi:hypothetical protein